VNRNKPDLGKFQPLVNSPSRPNLFPHNFTKVNGWLMPETSISAQRKTNLMTKYLFCTALLINFITAYATTTSTVNRAIKIDGLIGNTVSPGTNSTEWESDEVYPGYQKAINWYVSWDDNNFYLGRKGFPDPDGGGPQLGSNHIGSVFYMRANYPNDGNKFSNTATTYDAVSPDFSNMNGVNFVAYIKASYNEFRTYNGAWSAADKTLNPVFQYNVNGADFMELAIPWNKITNGNGKPQNIRLGMYLINLADGQCPGAPKIFGESPWGGKTGTEALGWPMLGVNDGAASSVSNQPGGCGIASAPIQRWWGCYPVISGVASNGYVAVAPNAGPDQDICDISTSTTMGGNQPSADAIGTWSYLPAKSTAGLVAPVIGNMNDKNSLITGLNGLGSYVFTWSINYGGCPAVPDTMTIWRWQSPTIAKAGKDTAFCMPRTTYTLRGNQPVIGKGKWTVTTGPAVLSRNDTAITNVSGLGTGMNAFTWTITNGPACAPSPSQVVVTINTLPKIISNPSPQNRCSPAPANFSITATGSNLKYQWQVSKQNGIAGFMNVPEKAPYSGTQTNNLAIATTDISMNGFYRCYITGTCLPADTSTPAKLLVNTAPLILGALNNQTVCQDKAFAFHSNVSGTSLKYIWKKNNIAIAGATNDSLFFPTPTTSDAGTYSYEVTGVCGSTQVSANAQLVVLAPPKINTDLNDQSACPGGNLTFSVKASGSNLNFSWMERTKNGAFTKIIPNANYSITNTAGSSDLTLSNLSLSQDSNSYQCLVTGDCSPSASSKIVLLRINPISIVAQPRDTLVCEKNSAFFSIKASGTGLNYVWNVSTNGGNTFSPLSSDTTYSGINNDTLKISKAINGMQHYIYNCTITGTCDGTTKFTKTSGNASLSVSSHSGTGKVSVINAPICTGTSTTLILSGNNGKVQWQQSASGTGGWSSVSGGMGADSTVYKSPPLTQTTYYRVLSKNSVCKTDTLQVPIKIEVFQKSKHGNLQASSSSICTSASIQLQVTNFNGVIQWQESDNPQSGWAALSGVAVPDSSMRQLSGLKHDTYFRVIVSNGVCAPDTSEDLRIQVSNLTKGGVLSSSNKAICPDGTVLVSLKGSVGNITWFQSSDGRAPWKTLKTTDPVFTSPSLKNTIFYRAIVKNGVCDTVASNTIKITLHKTPVFSLGNDTMICQEFGKPILIKTSQPFASYRWSDNSTAPFLTINNPGTYSVEVSDSNSCTAYSSININTCDKFFIPDIITPNDDKLNDSFVILGHKAGSSLEIYNRWGTLVFKRTSYLNGEWDGGSEVAGNYLYVYVLNNSDGARTTYTGWITLVK
jgi:gliding motility-associated-like protein